MQRACAILVLLLIAGCVAQTPRPNFLARSQQDRADGDQAACAMLGSLSATSSRAILANAEPRPRTQSQKDVDAIMAGMRRAHSSSPAQNMQMAPTQHPDS